MARNKIKSSKSKVWIVFVLFLVIGISFISYSFIQKETSFFEDKKELEKPKIQIVDESSSNRPYGVMINNLNVARPYHSGLQDAYLVYEMIVEGGITRYFALFQNQNTSRIGPIRSARPYYLDYAMENDAYFVHWGFSEQAKADISRLGIQNINGLYDTNYFWKDRSLSIATEHTAFTSMEKVKEATSKFHYRENRKNDYLLSYQIDDIDFSEHEDAMVANQVIIPYSSGTTTSYVYNPEQKVYQRFVNGTAHTDFVTKEQYIVKNIITYQVKNRAIDSYGRQQLDNIGKGRGFYITNGYAVAITWEKNSRESQTIYRDLNGDELVVNDGNTWIQIEPENQKLSITE